MYMLFILAAQGTGARMKPLQRIAAVDNAWSGSEGYTAVDTATLHCERLWVEANS